MTAVPSAAEETAPETEPELMDAVPELDFGGEDFTFLAADMYGAQSLVEGLTGEVYNDATYNVEVYAEERLNVNISEVLSPTGSMNATVVKLATSNDTTYDTISMTDRESVSVAMQGVFHPMAEIPYVDLKQRYWGDGLTEDLSIGGKEYFAISSFNLYTIERTAFVLFNHAVADKYNIEVPMEAAFNGTWTKDMFESYGSIATVDLNGDGIMDASDSYTYGCTDARDIAQKFLYAAGLKWVDIGDDGLPYASFYGNETVVDVVDWTTKIFYGDDSVPRYAYSSEFDNINALYELFVTDRELECVAEFRNMPLFREMPSDFSILPMPKYSDTQQRYYSYCNNGIFSMVPITALNLDKAGAVQEVMCCEGYKKMLPAYIEATMKNKIARNQESGDMIEVIYDTRTYDLGKLYLNTFFGGVGDSQKAGKSVVPTLAAQQSRIDSALEKTIASLLGTGE